MCVYIIQKEFRMKAHTSVSLSRGICCLLRLVFTQGPAQCGGPYMWGRGTEAVSLVSP